MACLQRRVRFGFTHQGDGKGRAFPAGGTKQVKENIRKSHLSHLEDKTEIHILYIRYSFKVSSKKTLIGSRSTSTIAKYGFHIKLLRFSYMKALQKVHAKMKL